MDTGIIPLETSRLDGAAVLTNHNVFKVQCLSK